VHVDARRHLLTEPSLEQFGQPAAVLDHPDRSRHVAKRVRQRLAVLRRNDPGDLPPVLVDDVADAAEQFRACGQRDRAPGGEGLARGADRRLTSSASAKATSPLWRPLAGL